jgi:hypothetical protein
MENGMILSIESSCDDSYSFLSRQSSKASLTTLTLGLTRRQAHAAKTAKELSSWN